MRKLSCVLLTASVLLAVAEDPALAINITVDYRYDTNSFFDTAEKRGAIEAAAGRLSRVITTSLSPAAFVNNNVDTRIGFSHPGTGADWQVSPASSAASDALANVTNGSPANEYRGEWSIDQDEWILYAGGRNLGSAAVGGTGTGLNFTSVFQDGGSPLNRGFRNTGGVNNLPLWGGAVSFDTDRDWHFDLDTPAPLGSLDLYSIALHEIGHALGLSTGVWQEWNVWSTGGVYDGPGSVAAYNEDNNASLTGLNLVGAGGDEHWEDGTYDSVIFPAGDPNYIGTVGPGALQDLIMEPTANFTGSLRRLELTNVDVGALADIGWSIVELDFLPGDYNNDNRVDVADYTVWRDSVGTGNVIGSYVEWRNNFGAVASVAGASTAPEPGALVLSLLAVVGGASFFGFRRVA